MTRDQAVAVLLAAGFVANGSTRTENVRIPTSAVPSGERRTLGGRLRFALPGTEVRATVGARTVCLYRREGRDVRFLGEGNYATKDFTADQLRTALGDES